MSLITDKIFYRALRSNAELVRRVKRIENTSIPIPDDSLLNEPVPYIIVTFDGLTNEATTKDSRYESNMDSVNIGIEVTAENREELADLTQMVRQTVRDFFLGIDDGDEDAWLVPIDYQLTASAVQYDSFKPCFYQTLRYQCDTNA